MLSFIKIKQGKCTEPLAFLDCTSYEQILLFSNGRTVNGSKVSHTHNVDFHHLIPSQLTTRSHEILQIQHVFRFLTCENAPAIHLSGSLQVNELNINFLKLLQFYIIIPFLTSPSRMQLHSQTYDMHKNRMSMGEHFNCHSLFLSKVQKIIIYSNQCSYHSFGNKTSTNVTFG